MSIVFKPSQPHSHLSLSQKKSKNKMTNLCSRLTERCVIAFNLPYSSTTLPARQVDLVNVYWYPVIKFQMNGTNLKPIKNISGLFVSLKFDRIASIFSTKTATMVFKPSQLHPHFLSGRVFKLRWLRKERIKKSKVNKCIYYICICVFIYHTYQVSWRLTILLSGEIGRQLVKAPLAAAISPYYWTMLGKQS